MTKRLVNGVRSPIEVIDLGLLRILQSGISIFLARENPFFFPAWIARGNPLFNNNLSYLLKREGIPPMGNMMNQWIIESTGPLVHQNQVSSNFINHDGEHNHYYYIT